MIRAICWAACGVISLFCLVVGGEAAGPVPAGWLPATPESLPRWRGFNLLEKFQAPSGRRPFQEEDFRLISKLGFNFVRLPMDYRVWIQDGDWDRFDEGVLGEIDQAVEWGRKYGIHVCLNFHRAPGYTVAQPPERLSLWTSADAQRVCAKHWALFARRYKGIPNERLSFNLLNEPSGVSAADYLKVVGRLVEAIRAEDPARLVISDGLDWGGKPLPELKSLRVAQATRGYAPLELTHYQASWVGGERFPRPEWPKPIDLNGTLLGPDKREGSHAFRIEGPFKSQTRLRMRILVVSNRARLVVEADGKGIWEREFVSGAGNGEWKEAHWKSEYGIFQNLFDRDYECSIPAGTREVRLQVASGDWLQVGEVGLRADHQAQEHRLALALKWAEPPGTVSYDPGSPGGPFHKLLVEGRDWLLRAQVEPWQKLKASGIGVMVGEWGAFNKTPHDVVLRWAEDSLAIWNQAGFGWALWNFRGPFGVMDSGREDVTYEDWEGHKLDRKLLELLQKY